MLFEMLSIPPPWLDPLFFLTSLAWALIRSFITFIICLFLGIAAVKVLDVMTPGIRELEDIKRHPVPTGLFSAGFFIFVSLTIMGSVIAPLPIGFQSGIGQAVNPLLVFSMRLPYFARRFCGLHSSHIHLNQGDISQLETVWN